MKITHVVAFILLGQPCSGQKVEKAGSVAPEDLGAYKWILSGTAQEDKVVIFRVSTMKDWNDKVITDIRDSVNYAPGKKQTGSAFFIDPKYFEPKVDEPQWYYQALGSSGWIEGNFEECSFNDDRAEISFKSRKRGKTTKIFEVFIKSYEEASLIYEGLPKMTPGVGWSWSGSPKAPGESEGTGQPATRPESKSEDGDKPQTGAEGRSN